MSTASIPQTITITALAHTGQGVGVLADGKKVFVWGSLPGETVTASITAEHARYAEAELLAVTASSPDRIEPVEAHYLSTGPWQHMTFAAENHHKMTFVRELLKRSSLAASEDTLADGIITDGAASHYRNKIQYRLIRRQGKWATAVYERGSHRLIPVEGDSSALPQLDAAARAICRMLDQQQAPADAYSTLTLRGSRTGKTVAALQGSRKLHDGTVLPAAVQGLCIDRPASPGARSAIRTIQQIGSLELSDTVLGQEFRYDAHSFFQVNLPVYEQALRRIRDLGYDSVVDMYAGVGSIGLSVAAKSAVLVEPNTASALMARKNVKATKLTVEVIDSPAEKALDAITSAWPLVVDPPRAGLHRRVVGRCLESRPPAIVYLSCNPITQLRDIERLADGYRLQTLAAYNFFPRTPHVETLAILQRRS